MDYYHTISTPAPQAKITSVHNWPVTELCSLFQQQHSVNRAQVFLV